MIPRRRLSLSPAIVYYMGIILILLLAFYLYQFALNDKNMSHDEEFEYTRVLTGQSFWQIPTEDWKLGRHVLALLLAKSSMMLLGDSLFSLRWPAAAMSLLSVALICRVGSWIAGKRTGLVAALLLAICPYAVFYAHYLRGYAGMIFYVLLAYYLCIRAMQTGAWRYWFGVAISMGLAIYNHQYSVLAWPGIWWLMVFYHKRQRLDQSLFWPRMMLVTIVSLAGVLFAFVPVVLPAFLKALQGDPSVLSSLFPTQRPTVAGSVLTSMAWFSGVGVNGLYSNSTVFYLLSGLIALAILLAVLRGQSGTIKLLLGWLLVPFAIYHLGKWLMPSLWARPQYFGFTLPFFLLLVASAPVEIWHSLREFLPFKSAGYYFISSLTLLMIAGFWIPPLYEMYRSELTGNWRAVASFLTPRLEPTDLILCEPFDHGWGADYGEANEICRRNLSYWINARKTKSVYPILSLGEASDYDFIATNPTEASRLDRVWVVVWDVPPGVNVQFSDHVAPPEWDRFGRTILLPPPQDATIVEAMMIHLERLSSLPHTPDTQFTHHLRLAQLASSLGQTERAEKEWQSVETLLPEVPRFAKYAAAARQTLGRPPLLQLPLYPLEANLDGIIRFEGFSLNPGKVVEPGDSVKLTLFWRALERPPANYTVFIHIYDEAGNMVFQDDFLPASLTSAWWPGDLVWQERTFSVPYGMGKGEYRVYTGMYLLTTMERLRVSGQSTDDNSVLLTILRVE